MLAYTLLGIDYNERTRAVRFPHTGPRTTLGAMTSRPSTKGSGWPGRRLMARQLQAGTCLSRMPFTICSAH